MRRTITGFSNPTVKFLRSLRDKKARRTEGLFLAEGLRIIAEARDSGRLPEIIAFAPEGGGHPLAAEIIAATEAAGGEAIETTPDILSKMSGKDNPQAILGAYRQPSTDLASIDRSASPLWLVAQALLRMAEAYSKLGRAAEARAIPIERSNPSKRAITARHSASSR